MDAPIVRIEKIKKSLLQIKEKVGQWQVQPGDEKIGAR